MYIQEGEIFVSSMGHLAMPRDIFSCYSWRKIGSTGHGCF